MNQAKVLMKLEDFKYGNPDSASAITPIGKFVAVTKGKNTEIREIASGELLSTLQVQLQILVNRTRFSETGRSVHGDCHALSSYWRELWGRRFAERIVRFSIRLARSTPLCIQR